MTARRVIPGFGLSLGFTMIYLGLIVLLPLAALVAKSSSLGVEGFVQSLGSTRVLSAFEVSFSCAAIAALLNALFGLLVAWVLVRYSFPGRRVIDALVDLPFALPTAVAGIALTALYAPDGWVGRWLTEAGLKVAFSRAGIVVALTFIGLPFVVRTLQPVLIDLDAELEEAARSLGATRWQCFARVVLPNLLPALITGATLAFARALGEYGSVIFIAGNMPHQTEVAPVIIMTRLEQFDYAGATAVGTTLLAGSLVLLLAINALQGWTRRRLGGAQ